MKVTTKKKIYFYMVSAAHTTGKAAHQEGYAAKWAFP